ncbi:MAG: efflux RND transporter periplasmic adaptor subunit [Acidobacteria bacterium]|nr:efflux RND transporter periplasmic adaptor subunit [Acidobacteriota bacterium]
MTRKKVLIGVGIVALAAALVYANFAFKKTVGPTVTVEAVAKRDLEAIVSASGKIRAKKQVNISADRMGRVVRLAVEEGDRVKAGQFLLQIDPRSLRTMVQRGEANLEGQRTRLQQAGILVENARVSLRQAQETLKRQQDLWRDKLTTREALEQAENQVALREGELRNSESAVGTQQQTIRSNQADLENARHDLSLVTVESPIDGLVVRRNIEEGETAVMGTMNQAGTVLLTIADMSVIEAEIEVDETDIPTVTRGQKVKVTIDAIPDKSFTATVTEVGNSPIQAAATGGARQATNFKVVVTLDGEIPAVRPGFTCTADITTATRRQAVSVPIQALTVREVTLDAAGKIVREPKTDKRRRPASGAGVASADELKPGQTKKEVEGVYLVRTDKTDTVEFVQVKTGIAGEKHFEVLDGLKAGDRVVTGPFNSVRDLGDGVTVKIETPTKKS